MYKNFKSNDKKEKLKRIALETVSIIDKGCYETSDGKFIDVSNDVTYSVNYSFIYELKDRIDDVILNKRRPSNLDVRLSKKYTYESLVDYKKEYENCSVFILNFASAKNPGGGFLNGSSAQEESLTRISGLYKSLSSRKEFYEKSKQNPNNGLYYNLAIYSPNVPFIRDCKNEELFIQPLFANVITCAAVNRGVASRYNMNNDLIKLEMVNRIKTIIELFIKQSNPSRKNILVLGAFGCGVFKNNSSEVAKSFNYVLDLYKEELSSLDLIIDFSIPDDLNYFEFKRWI